MVYDARVLRVLIASPSDVAEERDIVASTIQAWNDLNSAERQVVLLPLRWETHSSPEYGTRPQEVINQQIVDQCDLLVGMFWTRIGSPTGAADSGTLEEIERVASDGKPVMLYFSSAKAPPDSIDLDQLSKLRDFKKKTFPRALVESYATILEFRDKLGKQLDMQVRRLLADTDELTESDVGTDILFRLADPSTGEEIGTATTIEADLIQIRNFDSIPSYSEGTQSIGGMYLMIGNRPNPEYYRKMASHVVQQNLYRPIRFWIKNVGRVGARDVYVDITFDAGGSEMHLVPIASVPAEPPSKHLDYGYSMDWSGLRGPEIESQGDNNSRWKTHFEVSALQPQRAVSPEASPAGQ